MAVDCYESALQVSSPTDDVHNLTALTLMAWVNLDTASATVGFISINYASSFYRKGLGVLYSAGISYIVMYIDYYVDDAVTVAIPPSLGTWHHICGRWAESENSGRCEVFIDGVDASFIAGTPSGVVREDGGVLTLASMPSLFLSAMDGKLADAAIFNRRVTDAEIGNIASGALRASHLDPVFHMSLEASPGAVSTGDIGLRDTTGTGNHITLVAGTPTYYRDPPLHWPIAIEPTPSAGRVTYNSRPTMNVAPGTKLATMRRAV